MDVWKSSSFGGGGFAMPGITATVDHLFVPCGAVVPWRCLTKKSGWLEEEMFRKKKRLLPSGKLTWLAMENWKTTIF